MTLEAYYPKPLSKGLVNKSFIKEENINDVVQKLVSLNKIFNNDQEKKMTERYLLTDEILSSASLSFRKFNFSEYLDKLFNKGYKSDDLVEIRFMIDYYDNIINYSQKSEFEISFLKIIQHDLLDNRMKRRLPQGQINNERHPWLVDDNEKNGSFDMRLYIHKEDKKINELVDNVDEFVKNSGYQPLLTIAIAYGQLIMIHPWRYGNSRTIATIIPLLLNHFELIKQGNLYFNINSVFARDKQKYYKQLVTLFKQQTWNEWIIYFLEMVMMQIDRVNKIREFINNLSKKLIIEADILRSMEKRMKYFIPLLCNPIFTPRDLVDQYNFTYGSLYRIIKMLLEKNYIIKENRYNYVSYMLTSYYKQLKMI